MSEAVALQEDGKSIREGSRVLKHKSRWPARSSWGQFEASIYRTKAFSVPSLKVGGKIIIEVSHSGRTSQLCKPPSLPPKVVLRKEELDEWKLVSKTFAQTSPFVSETRVIQYEQISNVAITSSIYTWATRIL